MLGYTRVDISYLISFIFNETVGTGFNIGYNPNTGKVFGKLHTGVGAEGGFSFDPNDNGDEARQKCSNNLDLSLGAEVNYGVNVGPYGLGVSFSTDFFSGKHGNPNDLGNLQSNFNAAGAGAGAGAGMGAHVSLLVLISTRGNFDYSRLN